MSSFSNPKFSKSLRTNGTSKSKFNQSKDSKLMLRRGPPQPSRSWWTPDNILKSNQTSLWILALKSLQPSNKLLIRTHLIRHSSSQTRTLKISKQSRNLWILNKQRTGQLVLQFNKLISNKLNAISLYKTNNLLQLEHNHNAFVQSAWQVLPLKLPPGHRLKLALQVLPLDPPPGRQQQLALQVLLLNPLPGHQQQLASQVLPRNHL